VGKSSWRFLMPSNGKNATNFFPHLIFITNKIKIVFFLCFSSVAYKLAPEMMEFYYARDTLIADRIRYNKNVINKNYWEYQRIAA